MNMKTMRIGTSELLATRLAYGCWRIAGTWDPAEVTPEREKAGFDAVITAYEAGYTLFDLADIYCYGVCESIFGKVLKAVPEMRSKILIATKCGIRKEGDPDADAPYRYDFSAQHIIWSCEQSLKRLGIEVIDIYQLHRPDYLSNPEEIAAAFSQLKQTGKVREFGVSNFRPSQVTMLQKYCPMRLLSNQVEISLACLSPFEDGTIDQCLTEKMTPMAWSPLAGSLLGKGLKSDDREQRRIKLVPLFLRMQSIAEAKGVSPAAIALAWLLKHPSNIMPIVGSTNPERIKQAVQADTVELTREEWYRLLVAARGERLP